MGVWAEAGVALAAPEPAARPEEKLAMVIKVSEDEYVSNNNSEAGISLSGQLSNPASVSLDRKDTSPHPHSTHRSLSHYSQPLVYCTPRSYSFKASPHL